MNIYVETNFVLELAFLQEQSHSCRELLRKSAREEVTICVPAYSLVEPFETIHRRHRRQDELQHKLEWEFDQLSRTRTYSESARRLRLDASRLLAVSRGDEELRLDEVCRELTFGGSVIPLTAEVLTRSATLAARNDLKRQDATVLASVLEHLDTVPSDVSSLFLNRNSKDFQAPTILKALDARRCKLLSSFDDGLAYVESHLAD